MENQNKRTLGEYQEDAEVDLSGLSLYGVDLRDTGKCAGIAAGVLDRQRCTVAGTDVEEIRQRKKSPIE